MIFDNFDTSSERVLCSILFEIMFSLILFLSLLSPILSLPHSLSHPLSPSPSPSPSPSSHFVIITQARSMSTLLDDLLSLPQYGIYSFGEIFNPKGYNKMERIKRRIERGGGKEEMEEELTRNSSLALLYNERIHNPYGERLTIQNILRETISFFGSLRGRKGFKLLYEHIRRPILIPTNFTEKDESLFRPIADGEIEGLLGNEKEKKKKEKEKEKELKKESETESEDANTLLPSKPKGRDKFKTRDVIAFPYLHSQLTHSLGRYKLIFLIRDFFESGISNYEAKALKIWTFSFESLRRKKNQILLTSSLSLTPSEVEKLAKCLTFTCSLNIQLQREVEWFRLNSPEDAVFIPAEMLSHSASRNAMLRRTIAFLLDQKEEDVTIPGLEHTSIVFVSPLKFISMSI